MNCRAAPTRPSRTPRHASIAGGAAALSLALASSNAAADPYRLRVDAVGYTQQPQSPVGLLVLQGEDKAHPWVDTEALVWAGNGANTADALTMLVRLHDPRNTGELRLGRQILTVGAIRPIHLDGADGRVRLPTGTSFEVFGGVPVQPQLGYNAYDWATGGRASQYIGRDTTAGISYFQRRQHGALSTEEAGFDFASSPTRWFDLATRAAYDVINPGISEASASLAGRFGTLRPELYAIERSPSRLLPATSLFSALGDAPSQVIGGSLMWHAFPRLDVLPLLAARIVDGDVGLDATIRTTLRLDDRGEGAVMVEARRQDAGTERWTGIRTALRLPLTARLRSSTELELVAPDDPRGRGSVWPWGIVALRWTPWQTWEVAGAVEAASTPRNAREVNALVRLSKSWGAP